MFLRGAPISRTFEGLTKRWSFLTSGGRSLVFRFWPEIVPVSVVSLDAADGAGTNAILYTFVNNNPGEYVRCWLRKPGDGVIVHRLWTTSSQAEVFGLYARVRSGDPPAYTGTPVSIRDLGSVESQGQLIVGAPPTGWHFPHRQENWTVIEWRPQRPLVIAGNQYLDAWLSRDSGVNGTDYLGIDYTET